MTAPPGFKSAGWFVIDNRGDRRAGRVPSESHATELAARLDGVTPDQAPHVARELFVGDETAPAPDAPPAPETETVWDRDARACLGGLLADTALRARLDNFAKMAGEFADALAAERAKRGGAR